MNSANRRLMRSHLLACRPIVLAFTILVSGCEENVEQKVGGQVFCVPSDQLVDGTGPLGFLGEWYLFKDVPEGSSFRARLYFSQDGFILKESRSDAYKSRRRDMIILIDDKNHLSGYKDPEPGDWLWTEINDENSTHEKLEHESLILTKPSYYGKTSRFYLWNDANIPADGRISMDKGDRLLASCSGPLPTRSEGRRRTSCTRIISTEDVAVSYHFEFQYLTHYRSIEGYISESLKYWKSLCDTDNS